MSDIRDQIVDDRGTIKRLQLIFPGYHGYRVNEDLRDADIYLKDELYKKMLSIIEMLKSGESNLVSYGNFKTLEIIGKVRSQMQAVAADLKHHAAGYSGISVPIRINAKKISELYDLDLQIYQQIISLNDIVNKFVNASVSGNVDSNFLNQVSLILTNMNVTNASREKLLYGGV